MKKTKVVCCPPKDDDALFAHPRIYAEVADGLIWQCPYCGKSF